MRPHRIAGACLLLLAGCAMWRAPEPERLHLAAPAPPEPVVGEIRVFGDALPEERALELRARLRLEEPEIVARYQRILADDPFAGGTLQLRLDVNREGEVARVIRLVTDVNNNRIEGEIAEHLSAVRFAPGPETYLFYTMGFRPDPFEVLSVRGELDEDPPALAIDVLNRSAFRLSDVSVTVRVQDPRRAEPLRISRRRLRAEFQPYGRRTIRVPVTSQWASDRYSFLVDVDPALDEGE